MTNKMLKAKSPTDTYKWCIQIHTWHPGHFKLLSWITVFRNKHPLSWKRLILFHEAFCYIAVVQSALFCCTHPSTHWLCFQSLSSLSSPLLPCVSLHGWTMPRHSRLKVNWSSLQSFWLKQNRTGVCSVRHMHTCLRTHSSLLLDRSWSLKGA